MTENNSLEAASTWTLYRLYAELRSNNPLFAPALPFAYDLYLELTAARAK
jgi:hypothetical protein